MAYELVFCISLKHFLKSYQIVMCTIWYNMFESRSLSRPVAPPPPSFLSVRPLIDYRCSRVKWMWSSFLDWKKEEEEDFWFGLAPCENESGGYGRIMMILELIENNWQTHVSMSQEKTRNLSVISKMANPFTVKVNSLCLLMPNDNFVL